MQLIPYGAARKILLHTLYEASAGYKRANGLPTREWRAMGGSSANYMREQQQQPAGRLIRRGSSALV